MSDRRTTFFELAVGLGIDRGAQRVRRSAVRGKEVTPEDFLLGLLRNLRVLPLDPHSGIVLQIPLMVVSTSSPRHSPSLLSDTTTTSLAGDVAKHLPRKLDRYLQDQTRDAALFVDLNIGNQTRDDLVVRSKTVREAGFHRDQHPFLASLGDAIPSVVRDAQALVRLVFPLDGPGDQHRTAMLVLAVAVRSKRSEVDTKWLADRVSGFCSFLTNALRRSASSYLADVVPNKRVARRAAHRRADEPRQAPSHFPSVVDTLDDLQHQITALAHRSGLRDWGEAKNGLHFLVAFREVSRAEGYLRYRLTTRNTQALGTARMPTERLREEFARRTGELPRDLKRLVGNGSTAIRDRRARAYVRRCADALESTVKGSRSVDEARSKLRVAIESALFPLQCTPGFFVMQDNSPELIKDWLRDPRARGRFDRNYPELLMGFEALVMPERTYYSPLSDGDVCFGVCGVRGDLLDTPGGFELQDIIDSIAPVLRERLFEEKRQAVQDDLREAINRGLTGPTLMHRVLLHLRALAFFAIPTGPQPWSDTYHTKLVRSDSVPAMRALWTGANEAWFARVPVAAVSDAALDALERARHWRPASSASDQRSTADFLGDYLSWLRKDKQAASRRTASIRRAVDQGEIFRLSIAGAPGFEIVALVPDRRHVAAADAFLRQFAAICNEAYGVPRFIAKPEVLSHTFNRVLPFVEVTAVALDAGQETPLQVLTELLQVTLAYFRQALPPLKSQNYITVRGVVELLAEIARAIQWCAERDKSRIASEVSTRKAQILADAVKRIRILDDVHSTRIALDRRRALLFLWELALNVSLHARSRADVTFTASTSAIVLRIDNDNAGVVDRTGKYGTRALEHLAQYLGLVYVPDVNLRSYVSTVGLPRAMHV